MAGRHIIVIGASAGGVEALETLVRALPDSLPAAVFVAMHLAPGRGSLLPDILSRAGRLPALHPENGEAFEAGKIYVAPPDHHLLIHDGTMRLTRGARENLHRPAVDTLFRSAAVAHGPRVIGVVLTGNLDDGTAGLSAVKRCGGVAVVQDPGDASFPSMPTSALRNVPVDHCVPVAGMGPLLARLVADPAAASPAAPPDLEAEASMVEKHADHQTVLDKIGRRTTFTCPECQGTLWELTEDPVQFRCHVGHAFSPGTMLSEHSLRLEDALWAAIRGFEEKARIVDRVMVRARREDPDALDRLKERGETARRHAEELRKLIDSLPVEE